MCGPHRLTRSRRLTTPSLSILFALTRTNGQPNAEKRTVAILVEHAESRAVLRNDLVRHSGQLQLGALHIQWASQAAHGSAIAVPLLRGPFESLRRERGLCGSPTFSGDRSGSTTASLLLADAFLAFCARLMLGRPGEDAPTLPQARAPAR